MEATIYDNIEATCDSKNRETNPNSTCYCRRQIRCMEKSQNKTIILKFIAQHSHLYIPLLPQLTPLPTIGSVSEPSDKTRWQCKMPWRFKAFKHFQANFKRLGRWFIIYGIWKSAGKMNTPLWRQMLINNLPFCVSEFGGRLDPATRTRVCHVTTQGTFSHNILYTILVHKTPGNQSLRLFESLSFEVRMLSEIDCLIESWPSG